MSESFHFYISVAKFSWLCNYLIIKDDNEDMIERAVTKTETSMIKFMESLEPESLRFRVLDCAVRFKSNWIDLGELLSSIIKNSGFKEWGYENFEEYCKHELRIKHDTAMKLVTSFGYVKKYKPELASPESPMPAPDYRLITKLMEAEKAPGLNEDDFKTLRRSVFNEGVSPQALNKQICKLSGAEESQPDNHERQLERLKFLITSLKKTIYRFDPGREIADAIEIIENFTSNLEV